MTENRVPAALVWEGNLLYLAWPSKSRQRAGKITFDPGHHQWVAWNELKQYLGSFRAEREAREAVKQYAAKAAAGEREAT
jgi:hypothetical protein